jgi:hypothetical protein
MPHAISDVTDAYLQPQVKRRQKVKSLSRELQHISTSLDYLQALYAQSQLSQTISRQLQATIRNRASPLTRVVSLGLGSLLVAKGQSRRLKQLTILLAIRDNLQKAMGTPVEVYAQDPSFIRADETFLTSLGIRILRTSSGASLGEAASIISPSTLVYSPFLTLEVYEQLLFTSDGSISQLFGDDFNALINKWPKHSAERKQVDHMAKLGLSRYKRKAISGEGFWTEEDETFPMAIYERLSTAREGNVKARI